MNERPIPEAANRDENSVEMLRAWIAERGLHCSMKVGMYSEMGKSEERAWGILLADVTRHIANALFEEHGIEKTKTLTSIRESYLTELSKPTSEVKGKFV